jgi:hypothetical protein
VSGEVLGRCADGDRGFEDLEAYVGPFPDGFEVYAPGGEGVDEIAAGGFEGVCADKDWAGDFVCLKEFDCLGGLESVSGTARVYLGNREHFEEFAGKVRIVGVV